MRIAFIIFYFFFGAIPSVLLGRESDTLKTNYPIFEQNRNDSLSVKWSATFFNAFKKVAPERAFNQENFKLGEIANSRFEDLLSGDNGKLKGLLVTQNSQLTQNSNPQKLPQLRSLLKFDWFGSDTLRNILLLSPMNDSALDLTATLTQWVQIPEVKNVEINAKDSFLPKRDPSNTVDENYGYNVFLPEMYLMPLPCFHAPIFIEFWGVDNATVYRDMDRLEGLSFSNVIDILSDFKSHIQNYHSVDCLTESLKLRLYMKNKDVKVAELVRFVDLITDLNYKLEVK